MSNLDGAEEVAEAIWAATDKSVDMKGRLTGEWPRDAEYLHGGSDRYRAAAKGAIVAYKSWLRKNGWVIVGGGCYEPEN